MIYPFRKTVFNCKQATLLSIKKDEGKITPTERLKLWYHLLYCGPCNRFIAQWHKLTSLRKERGDVVVFKLSEEAKQRIDKNLSSL
jgi:hypothetical protein